MSSKKTSILIGLAFAISFSSLLFAFRLAHPSSHAQSPSLQITASGSGLSIHIAGNQLVNVQGKDVRLLGVGVIANCHNAPGLHEPTGAAAIQALKLWHINVVRLSSLDEDCWLGINNPPISSTAYRNDVIQYINQLNQAGIYTIIDLHLNAPGTNFAASQQVMADADHSLAYWTSAADTFKNDPAVVFEAYNEPHITSQNTQIPAGKTPWYCWLHGSATAGQCKVTVYSTARGVSQPASPFWPMAGMQQIVNTIRGQGAHNIISLGGLSFSNDLSGVVQNLPSDPLHQLATSFHSYYGWSCGSGGAGKTDCWDGTVATVAKTLPVLTTELGEKNNCLNAYPTQYMNWADQQWNQSHLSISYMAWSWTPGTCGTGLTSVDAGIFGLLKDWSGTASSYGQPILTHIKQENQSTPPPLPEPTPSVNLTAPAPGASVSGSNVAVSATASVSSGSISNLTLKAGGNTLKACTGSPCSASWDTTGLSNSSYTITAATTASDGKTNTATESVIVSNATSTTISPATNLHSPSQTETSISLSWSAAHDPKYPASKLVYHIARNGATVGSTTAGATSYTDSGLSPGTYYSYTITATDPTGHSSAQSAALAQPTKKPNCPAADAPHNFTATAVSATTVTLRWQVVPPPSSTCTIAHYVVERGGTALAQPTATSYTDRTLTPRTTYTYTVLAIVTGNIAGLSSRTTAMTPAATQPDPGPTAPTRLAATPASTTQVDLTWVASTDAVTGIKQYEVLRNSTPVGSTTTTSFGDTGLQPYTTYSYQVQAASGGGKVTGSATIKVVTPHSPGSNPVSSTNPATAASPLLAGTTSVGSGSDTGKTVSQNPTAPGSNTSIATGPVPSHGLTFRRVADVGGSLVTVAVLAAGVWLFWWWRPRRYPTAPVDPDLYPATVVRPHPENKSNENQEHQP